MPNQDREKLDNLITVKTPENISFQYRVAGPFRRFLAFALDIIISLVSYWFIVIVFMILLAMVTSFAGRSISEMIMETMSGVFLAIGFFVYWFYGAIMETFWNGQTYGKMIMRLRTLNWNGEAIDGTQALLRNFFRLIDCFPFVGIVVLMGPEIAEEVFGEIDQAVSNLPTFMCGLIVMTLSRKYQRVGDLVAGTIVVHEQKSLSYDLAKFEDARVAQLAELIPSDFYVSSGLRKALASYVGRRNKLPYERNSEIASHLAMPLLRRFGIPTNTDNDLFLCALYYRAFVSNIDQEITSYQTTQANSPYATTITVSGDYRS